MSDSESVNSEGSDAESVNSGSRFVGEKLISRIRLILVIKSHYFLPISLLDRGLRLGRAADQNPARIPMSDETRKAIRIKAKRRL